MRDRARTLGGSLRLVAPASARNFRWVILRPTNKRYLAAWEQHPYAEFGLKDPEAALASMTEDPYVLNIPSGTGGVGRAAVHQFYADQMLPNLPPDLELVSLSQIFGDDRIVEEFVIRFTHTLKMDWMLPGVSATNRKVEFVLAGIVGFQSGKVASEHLLWDQATVLYQLAILDHPTTPAGVGSAAHFLKLSPRAVTAGEASRSRTESMMPTI